MGYEGDSILNSLSDLAFCALGFLFAWKRSVLTVVAVFFSLELITLYFIKDNLILNIVMLLWPIEAIKQWQAG